MRRNGSVKTPELRQRREVPLTTPTDLRRSTTKEIAGAMNAILADVFLLYLKTKNFHWHMSGPHFRDDRPDRGTNSKKWRTNTQVDWPYRPPATGAR
jgi:hypothetical protein